MSRIPARQEDGSKFLAVVVLLGLGAIYWIYLYAPRAGELALDRDRLARLQIQNDEARAHVAGLDRVREDLSSRRALLRQVEARLTPGLEVAVLYDAIARIAAGLDLETVSVTPAGPTPVENGDYLRQRWMMVLEGDYHRVGRFLSDVAAMDGIVRPAVITITAPEGRARNSVRASLEIDALILPREVSPTGSAGTPNEGG